MPKKSQINEYSDSFMIICELLDVIAKLKG